MVWGHDALPAGDDPFVKGVEEWIAFAEMVSGCLVLNLNAFRDANGWVDKFVFWGGGYS